jgi:SAM-dependent methyltransferase
MDPKRLVREGYNELSYLYRGDSKDDGNYPQWVEALDKRLPRAATVLDLGCGNGIPVSQLLVAAGHHVTGVDISDVQIERARELVPGATFVREDATELELPAGSLDAVVSLFALIHVPLDEQPALIAKIAGWLKPQGILLATTGHTAWTGTEDTWLGGNAPMWWSHADRDTYRQWFTQAGLQVELEEFVPEGDSGHSLFWTRKP